MIPRVDIRHNTSNFNSVLVFWPLPGAVGFGFGGGSVSFSKNKKNKKEKK